MKSAAGQTLGSRWFATCVHGGFWLLLYLAVAGLGGKSPDFRETDSFSAPPQSAAPVAKVQQLFSPPFYPKTADTNLLNPVFTRHFIPAQPPAPTTRKIEMTYEGFYQTAESAKQTIVRIGEAFIVTPIGGRVISNLFASDATLNALILTNLSAQTNILLLNTKKEIEVPIQ
jgi:hypothetical protein